MLQGRNLTVHWRFSWADRIGYPPSNNITIMKLKLRKLKSAHCCLRRTVRKGKFTRTRVNFYILSYINIYIYGTIILWAYRWRVCRLLPKYLVISYFFFLERYVYLKSVAKNSRYVYMLNKSNISLVFYQIIMFVIIKTFFLSNNQYDF